VHDRQPTYFTNLRRKKTLIGTCEELSILQQITDAFKALETQNAFQVSPFVIQRHTWLWVRLLSEVVESSNPNWTPSCHVLCIQVVTVETVIRVISLKKNKTKQNKKQEKQKAHMDLTFLKRKATQY
jgi:hypothetical protein